MLIPGRGWTSAIHALSGVPGFSLLGPFRRGQYLERIVFGLTAVTSSTVSMGAVIGQVGEASVVAWRAGRPLIDRSNLSGDGHPVLSLRQFGSIGTVWPVMLGVRVTEGPAYIVWRMEVVSGVSVVSAYATCEVLEEEERGRENGAR